MQYPVTLQKHCVLTHILLYVTLDRYVDFVASCIHMYQKYTYVGVYISVDS